MLSLIGTIVVGLIVGLIARALKPGDDSMGWIMTIILGIAGSLIANKGISLYFSALHGSAVNLTAKARVASPE